MLNAFKTVDKYLKGESWVVGDDAAQVDKAKLVAALQSQYSADYAAQWRRFLQSASVSRYANVKDAAAKLAVLSGNQSPLLALFSTVSQNTALPLLPDVVTVFQPTQTITPAGGHRQARRPRQREVHQRVADAAVVARSDGERHGRQSGGSRRSGIDQRDGREDGGAADRVGLHDRSERAAKSALDGAESVGSTDRLCRADAQELWLGRNQRSLTSVLLRRALGSHEVPVQPRRDAASVARRRFGVAQARHRQPVALL